jgi:pimeloyl-ACP methyl ester carboxylesterase
MRSALVLHLTFPLISNKLCMMKSSSVALHKTSSSEFLPIRGLRAHIRQWGDPAAPRLFMLHGWMDVSASFQFVVDCLCAEWHVIAPDWRGFGLSERSGRDAYWYPDYLADLEAILLHYSPQEPVRLLGHSMGANVATMYAGIRPGRIARLINLEGFGLPDTRPDDAPAHYARWLDQLHTRPRLHDYATQQQVALRLQKKIRGSPMNGLHSWRGTGRRKMRRAAGKSWVIPCIRTVIRYCSGPPRCWRAGSALLRRPCGWRPTRRQLRTNSATRPRRAPNWTGGWRISRMRRRRASPTPATCCITISRRCWRK